MVTGRPLYFLTLAFSSLLLLLNPSHISASPIRVRGTTFNRPLICTTAIKATDYRNTCLKGDEGGPVGGLALGEGKALSYLSPSLMQAALRTNAKGSIHCDQ